MGAGALGGFYGGMLARAGEDVTFLARGEHLAQLREKGLRVESPHLDDFHLPRVKASDDPAAAGRVELVLVGVKAYDLENASHAIRSLIGPDTSVLPLLNGVDIAERIGAVVGAEHLLGGVVYLSAMIARPGVIRVVRLDRLLFGEMGGGASARCEAILAVMERAGIPAEVSRDIRAEVWRKFVLVNAVAGLASLARSGMVPIMADRDTRALLEGAMREVEALAQAQAIHLDANLCEQHMALADTLPAEYKPSMLLDLERGRKLELDALQGTAVRLGRQLGVATPINAVIYGALKLYAGGRPQ